MNTKQYLGLTKEQAIELAKQNNTKCRISSENGQAKMMTMDFVRDRINLVIENDLVKEVKLG